MPRDYISSANIVTDLQEGDTQGLSEHKKESQLEFLEVASVHSGVSAQQEATNCLANLFAILRLGH